MSRESSSWLSQGMVARTDGSQMCATDPELFFAEEAHAVSEARAACARCPFFVGCRIEGLQNSEQGVWGGLSFNQRVRMGSLGRQQELERLLALQGNQQREAS